MQVNNFIPGNFHNSFSNECPVIKADDLAARRYAKVVRDHNIEGQLYAFLDYKHYEIRLVHMLQGKPVMQVLGQFSWEIGFHALGTGKAAIPAETFEKVIKNELFAAVEKSDAILKEYKTKRTQITAESGFIEGVTSDHENIFPSDGIDIFCEYRPGSETVLLDLDDTLSINIHLFMKTALGFAETELMKLGVFVFSMYDEGARIENFNPLEPLSAQTAA